MTDPAPSSSFAEVLRRQRMVRPPYAERPVDRAVVDRILTAARKAPSAGFTQGTEFVVLHGEATERFAALVWPRTSPAERHRLPVVVIPLEHAQAYLDRYSEPDKAASGLGGSTAAWPAPFWTVDAAFATMLVLLAATAEGVGAWFFGIFTGERELLDELGVPEGYRAIGAVALGHPGPGARRTGSVATRPSRPLTDVVHHDRW